MQEGLRLSEQCLQCVGQRRGRPLLPPYIHGSQVRYGNFLGSSLCGGMEKDLF